MVMLLSLHEILPEGIPAVKRLADYLKDIKTDINFTSPYLRCKQTVDIISKVSGGNLMSTKDYGILIAD
jgi:broad specificity phosphatase PhoE